MWEKRSSSSHGEVGLLPRTPAPRMVPGMSGCLFSSHSMIEWMNDIHYRETPSLSRRLSVHYFEKQWEHSWIFLCSKVMRQDLGRLGLPVAAPVQWGWGVPYRPQGALQAGPREGHYGPWHSCLEGGPGGSAYFPYLATCKGEGQC